MRKSIVVLSTVAALSTSAFAATISNEEMMQQIEALKAQIATLEGKLEKTPVLNDDRFQKLEKKVDLIGSTAAAAKSAAAGDNIKWDIDFRTQVDNVQYKTAGGTKKSNNALLTNRLQLGMAFAPNDNTVFKGLLSYNKLYGENVTTVGNSAFDWIKSEAAGSDNALNVKEAYWLYKDDTLAGLDIPWTVSVGRRPSTDGLGINLRVDQERKSPLSHTVNVEFDGASAKLDLEKLTGVPGMWFKLCMGRGLTNSTLRFDGNGYDYVNDGTSTSNIDMGGFIFVPYDDGQYSIHTNYAYAVNLIGYLDRSPQDGTPDSASFTDVGDFTLANIMFKVDGIGDGISDYLDDTTAFASFAMSKTHPNSIGMLGSDKSETGHSIWLGVNAPCPISPDDARIGIEWNKGSKYWRSFTYGEDTAIGSKLAARGTAWEVYRNAKINNALDWSFRYTHVNYDYTGSNGFFADFGAPMDINDPLAVNAVKEAQNITAYVRYRF